MENEINGATQLFSFFAHPAKHSFSPLMYNTSFDQLNINARYLAFDIEPQNFAVALQAMRTLSVQGGNLSMPFKKAAVDLLDEVTPRAKLLQSVNVIKNDQGRLIGDSVDGAGFFLHLEQQGIKMQGKSMTVFGAGGAGRSIIQAGIEQKLKSIKVFKRKNASFTEIEHQLSEMNKGSTTDVKLIAYEDQDEMKQAIKASELIVNTTNLGMGKYEAEMPAPPGVLQTLTDQQVVYDVIYSPAETQLIKFAKQRGCQTFNGLGMLIYQGALSLKYWLNQDMPIAEVSRQIQLQLNL